MQNGSSNAPRVNAIARSETMLRDEIALLANPERHHKALIVQANALHREQVISSDDLSDLLEQSDVRASVRSGSIA